MEHHLVSDWMTRDPHTVSPWMALLDANQIVADVMTPNPISIRPEASLAEAAEIMYENKFGGLPVVENGQLIGIITASDFFRLVMIEARKGSD